MQPIDKPGDFRIGVGIVETLHRYEMRHLRKGSLRPSPDFLSRGIGCEQLRMRQFQIEKLPVECIILPVRDLRLGLLIIETIMMGNPSAQFSYLLPGSR